MKLALLFLPIIVFAPSCGHTPCDTDADCEAGFVCNAQACTKTGNTQERPEDCGDRCTIGADRCEFHPLDSAFQRCDVVDGCSKWTLVEQCGTAGVCRNDDGCVAYLGEGASCGDDARCGLELRCESLAFAGGADSATCLRSCAGGDCLADQTCVNNVCIPSILCEACTPGQDNCADTKSPERCEFVDEGCSRWVSLGMCTGTNVCEAAECVGTVVIGDACTAENNCVRDAVCLSDTSVCDAVCRASAQCTGGERCRLTAASQGKGICKQSAGPTVETTCTIGLGRLEVSGDWDSVGSNPSSFAPDPYVQIDGGEFNFVTGEAADSRSVELNQTTPELSLESLYFSTLTVWDSDSPFSPPDPIASWRLIDHFPWEGSTRMHTLSLSAGGAALSLAINCVDR